jgi:hypothetical protein
LTAQGASGAIAESGFGLINTTGLLTTSSVIGETLNGANAVGSFSATDLGAVSLTNTATSLALGTVTSSGLTVNNTGLLVINNAISEGANSVALTATGITNLSTVTASGGVYLNYGTGTLTNATANSIISNGGAANAAPITLIGDNTNLFGGSVVGGAGTVSMDFFTHTLAASGMGGVGYFSMISTTGTLQVGSLLDTGVMTITGPLVASTYKLVLENSGGISNNSAISGNYGIVLNAGTGTITNTAGSITNTGGTTGFISLTADKMALTGGTISGGAGYVGIYNSTLTNAINLGSSVDTTANTLELSNTELNTISSTAGLQVGSASNSGAITVSSALSVANGLRLRLSNGASGIAINGTINAPSGIWLDTAGPVSQTAAITAPTLILSGTGAFNLNGASNIIASIAGNVGSLSLLDSAAVSVDTVVADSLNTFVGISATGPVSLMSSGALSQTSAISTPGLLTTSSVGGTTLNSANTVGSFSGANSTSGNLTLTNTYAPFTINAISNTGGNVVVDNTGGIVVAGVLSSQGSFDMTAHSPITINTGGSITAGGSVVLIAGAAASASPLDLITIYGTITGSSVRLAAHHVSGNIPAGAVIDEAGVAPPAAVLDPIIVGLLPPTIIITKPSDNLVTTSTDAAPVLGTEPVAGVDEKNEEIASVATSVDKAAGKPINSVTAKALPVCSN